MHSLSVSLSEEVFISPSLLKDNFAGYRILGWWFFFFFPFEHLEPGYPTLFLLVPFK